MGRLPVEINVKYCGADSDECGSCDRLAFYVAYECLPDRYNPNNRGILAESVVSLVNSVVEVEFPVRILSDGVIGTDLSCSDRRKVVASLAAQQAALLGNRSDEMIG